MVVAVRTWRDEARQVMSMRMIGDKIIRRGRPPGSAKRLVSLRLDQAVIDPEHEG